MKTLQMKLMQVESKHLNKKAKAAQNKTKRLRVFYGWAKVNKIRKKEAISVIFENDLQNEERTQRALRKAQNTVYVREQTEQEKKDAVGSTRMFTEYSIFLSDKDISGSLERALQVNFEADKNHVSEGERQKIKKLLKDEFLINHIGYKEPCGLQLNLNF